MARFFLRDVHLMKQQSGFSSSNEITLLILQSYLTTWRISSPSFPILIVVCCDNPNYGISMYFIIPSSIFNHIHYSSNLNFESNETFSCSPFQFFFILHVTVNWGHENTSGGLSSPSVCFGENDSSLYLVQVLLGTLIQQPVLRQTKALRYSSSPIDMRSKYTVRKDKD